MRVTIMGLGLFTGGVGTARFFVAQGARVTVTDLKDADALRPSLEALRGLPIRFVLGEHREEDILDADLVVISPAIPESNPYLRLARTHGIRLTTELNQVFERCRAPIIGVTGSNGKTTTTSLIGAIFRSYDNRTLVGGNIGRSLLNEIDEAPADTTVVLELSSFQLKRLGWIDRSPHISVVTNVSPNHLDWHGTYEDYVASKQQAILSQTEDDIAILNADDRIVRDWSAVCRGRVFRFSVDRLVERGACVQEQRIVYRHDGHVRDICAVDDVRIPGRHNLENALAAITAACACDMPVSIIRSAVAAFRGVAHRLEFIVERDGVRYYNDSACTTPESTITALRAFASPAILIAGGYDKGVDFGMMADEIVRRTRAVVLIGTTADAIEAAVRSRRSGDTPVIVRSSSINEAVAYCRTFAQYGDAVILSPGCASYDMFTNFEERGNMFKDSCQ